MPAWLVRTAHVRSVELVSEFLRRTAGTRNREEALQHSCEIARQLFEADQVILWRLDRARACLEAWAASPPGEEPLGELAVDAVLAWKDALADGTPCWVPLAKGGQQPVPFPLLGARSALVVPVGARACTSGCLLALWTGTNAAPAHKELKAGAALAHAVGLMLELQTLEENSRALQRRHEAQRGWAKELSRCGCSSAGLSRLTAAAQELSGAEAVGLYEQQRTGFTRVAAAGAVHRLPTDLPTGDAEVFPSSFPQSTRAHLRVLPVNSKQTRLGVLLACGTTGTTRIQDNELEESLLPLLAAGLEHRRLELQLMEHQHRQEALLEHAPEGVFYLDPAGRLRSANNRLLRWIGYSGEELSSRSLTGFLHPNDRRAVGEWLQSRRQEAYRSGVRWQKKAGGWLLLELVLHAFPATCKAETAILGLARQGSHPTQSDGHVQLSQAWLQGVLDSSHDGVWVIDADGRVALANHRLSQLLGVNLHELEPGVPQAEVLAALKPHFDSPETVLERWRQIQESPDEVCWDELELQQPQRRVLERFARPLFDRQNQLAGRLEIYRDITSQRLLEDKVVQREKLASVGKLVSGVAHELNNPLTAVSGYAQLLLGGRLPAELREMTRRLYREAGRAGRIVKNLLLYARGDETEKRAVDLAEVLDRTLALRTYELKVKNIRVVRNYARAAPPVWANPHQLQQVFLNLLINAEQSIRGRRDHGQVKVSIVWRRGEDRVQVHVADDGPGIPAALLPYVFDPFFTTKPNQEGTGLGLSVSHAIIVEHGGKIRAESASGEGATFIVELPARVPSAQIPPARRSKARRRTGASEHSGGHILVVDDEPEVGQFIADALRRLGYTVRVHTESPRALAEALRQPFHLVICDIRMPELDGQGFHRALCEQQSALARRVLFTTGDTLAPETVEFLERVQLPHLAKPFHVEELHAAVQMALRDGEHCAEKDRPRDQK